MSAFAELQEAYSNRLAAARAAAAIGQKVVGLVGATVPVELVLGAGGFPVNLAPLQGARTPLADRYLEAHFDHLRLHAAIEAGGAVVVAEDDAWGSRFAGRDVPEDSPDLLEAVFEKYFFGVPSPRQAPASARDEWLRAELGRGGFDAAVFYIPPEDQWFGWDYPRLRALVEDAGLPSLLLRDLDSAAVERFLQEGARV